MMGTRLHTGTADGALLPDGDQLSPVANAAVEDRAASETADFASTLQDLIDSHYQKESDASSESSVAADVSSQEASLKTVAGTTTNAGPQPTINHARVPIVSSGTTRSAVKSTYVAVGNSEAGKAYQPTTQRFDPLLRGAKSIANLSDPTEPSLPFTVEAKPVATTSHFALESQPTNSDTSASRLARALKSTINQDLQDLNSPISIASSTQPKARSSQSPNIGPHTLNASVTRDVAKQSAVTSVGGIELSKTRIERNTDDVSVSSIQVSAANSAASKTLPHAVAREDASPEAASTVSIPTSSANSHIATPASPSTLVATYNRFTKYSVTEHSNSLRPTPSGSRNAGLKPTIADGVSKSKSGEASLDQQNNAARTSAVRQVIPTTVRADFARTTASPVNGDDPKQSPSSKIANPASASPGPALSASQTPTSYRLLRTEKADAQTSASNIRGLAPSESREVPLRPTDGNVTSKAETPTDKRNNTGGSSVAQIKLAALRDDSTEATPRAVSGGEPTQSSPIKLAKSDPQSPSPALLAAQSVPRSPVLQTEKVHDLTSVVSMDSDKASDNTTGRVSTAPSGSTNSPSSKPARSESNTPDELPDPQSRQSVTLATTLTANKSTSTAIPSGAPNRIAPSATMDEIAGIDVYESAQKKDLTNGAAVSARTGDRVVHRSLAPAVSSGAKHLASDATAYAAIEEPGTPTQTPDRSESTTFTQVGASSAGIGDLEESRNSNAPGSHSVKSSDSEHAGAEVAAPDQIHLAESAPINDRVKVDSLASLKGAPQAESAITNSPRARHESRGDLRQDEFVESSALPPDDASSNGIARAASENTSPANESLRVMATVDTSGLQHEASRVSNVVPATTQPDAHSVTSQLPADSQALAQPVRISDEDHFHTYNDSPVLNAAAPAATVSENRPIRLSKASNDSAASHLRSRDENTAQKVSPAVETNSAPSNSVEEAVPQGRHLAEATSEAASLPPEPNTTPASENPLAEPISTPSSIPTEQAEQVHDTTKQESIFVSEAVVHSAVSVSASSHLRSLGGNASRSVAPTFETSSTPSGSVEAGTDQGVLLPEATSEAASLPPQLTSTPANANALAQPSGPASFTPVRQADNTNTLDSNDVSHRDESKSAVSENKSSEETTSRSVSPDSETGSAASNSSEAGTHQDRLFAEVAGEASSLLSQPTSTLAHTNTQPESANPPSNTDTKLTAEAQTPGSIVSPNAILRSDNSPSPARGSEPATVSVVQDATPTIEVGRVANLQIELANGGNAQATIRERAGSIEVKIVTPTSAWAQRVSNEIDSMRRNLDSAGIRLGQAEVSYQPGDGGGRGGSGHQRPQQRDISTKDEQIFTLSEVTE